MSAMFVVYHGPPGLRDIAVRVCNATLVLDEGIQKRNHKQLNDVYCDTLYIVPAADHDDACIKMRSQEKKINLRYFDDGAIGVALDETTTMQDVDDLLWIFYCEKVDEVLKSDSVIKSQSILKGAFRRTSPYLTHPVFNMHHSESRIVRFMRRLENKDISRSFYD